jgi:hypothetical protein
MSVPVRQNVEMTLARILRLAGVSADRQTSLSSTGKFSEVEDVDVHAAQFFLLYSAGTDDPPDQLLP